MSQSLKIGTQGNETELPIKSRQFSSISPEIIKQSERSINGTLNTDYINYKETFVVSYDVISEADRLTLETIIKEQTTNGNELFFIYTNSAGTPTTKAVDVTLDTIGSEIPRDGYYYNGTRLVLVER